MPPNLIEISTVLALFLAIIGCYRYLSTTKGQLEDRITVVSECWEAKLNEHVEQSDSQLRELSREVGGMNVSLTNRLTSIETTLGTLLPALLDRLGQRE